FRVTTKWKLLPRIVNDLSSISRFGTVGRGPDGAAVPGAGRDYPADAAADVALCERGIPGGGSGFRPIGLRIILQARSYGGLPVACGPWTRWTTSCCWRCYLRCWCSWARHCCWDCTGWAWPS